MENQRQNGHKLVSAHDALSTLMSLTGIPQQDLFTEYERENFVHGEHLAFGVLPENRAVYGWQGKPFSPQSMSLVLSSNMMKLIYSQMIIQRLLVLFKDPFPELLLLHTKLSWKTSISIRNLLNMAPFNYEKVVKNVYGVEW